MHHLLRSGLLFLVFSVSAVAQDSLVRYQTRHLVNYVPAKKAPSKPLPPLVVGGRDENGHVIISVGRRQPYIPASPAPKQAVINTTTVVKNPAPVVAVPPKTAMLPPVQQAPVISRTQYALPMLQKFSFPQGPACGPKG